MTKKREPGSFLLSMIGKVRADMPLAVEELSDAELTRSMARGLSDFIRAGIPDHAGDDDYTTLACVFALDRAHAGYHPNTGEANAIAQAHDLLAEIDIEITPEDLRGIWHSEGFADFRQKFHQFGARRFDDRSV